MSNQDKIIEDPEESQIESKSLQPSKQIVIKKPNSSTFNQSFLENSIKNEDKIIFSIVNSLLTKENKDFLMEIPFSSKKKKENTRKDDVIVINTSKSSKDLISLMIFNQKEEENLKKHTEKLNFHIEFLKKELKYDGFIKENLQKKAMRLKIKELSEISNSNMKRISLLIHDNERIESQIKTKNKSEQRRKFQLDFEKEKENANQKIKTWKKSRIDLEKKANIRKAIIELENEDKMNKEKERKKEEFERRQKEIEEKREKYIRKMKEIHNEVLNIKEDKNKSIDDIRLIKNRKYKYQIMNEMYDTKEYKEKELYDEKIKKVKSSKKKKVPTQEEFDDFYSRINIKKSEFEEKSTKKIRNPYANHVNDTNVNEHEKSVFYIRLEEESLKIKSEEEEKELKKKENFSKKKNFLKSNHAPSPDERKRKEMKEMKKSHIGMHIMNRNYKQSKGNSQFNRMKKRMIRFSNKLKSEMKRKEKEEQEKTSIDISNIVVKTKTDMENNLKNTRKTLKSIVKNMNFSSIHTNQRFISSISNNKSIEIRKPMKKYPNYLVELRKLTSSQNESRYLVDKLSKVSKLSKGKEGSKEGKEGKSFVNSKDHGNIYEYFKLKNEIENLEEKTSKKMKLMKEMKRMTNKDKDNQYEIWKSSNDLSNFFSFQLKKKFRLLKLMSNVK